MVHHSVILEFDFPSYRTDADQHCGEITVAEASAASAEEMNRQN